MVSDASFLLSFLEHITLTKTFKKTHVHKTDPVFCLHTSITFIVKILPCEYAQLQFNLWHDNETKTKHSSALMIFLQSDARCHLRGR